MAKAIQTAPARRQHLIDLGAARTETKGGETTNDIDGTVLQQKHIGGLSRD